MLQRLMRTLAVSTATCVLFSACKKHTYSPDEPLQPTYSASVFIASQNKIFYALDPVSGARKWEINMHDNIFATPLVVGDKIYVAGESNDLVFTVDIKAAKLKDTIDLNPPDTLAGGIISSPVADGNSVYFGTTEGYLSAVPYNSKTPRWTVKLTAGIQASLALSSGNIIVATIDNKVHAVSTANGSVLWTTDLGTVGFGLFSSPLVSPPYIYVGSPDGNLYALDVNSGTIRWSFITQAQVLSSPIMYGGNVIIGSNDNYLYCIDTAAKQPRWMFKTNDRIISSPAAANQVVYIGSYDSHLYAVNIIDGTLKWKYQMGALVQSTPLVHNGTVYAASFDKHMYTFDTSGVLKWKYNINGPVQTSPVYYDLTRAYYPTITGSAAY